MKVPYLKERRRQEMTELATEFSNAILVNLDPTKLEPKLHSGWLNNLHPLFALLQLFLNNSNSLNPSREFALEGARQIGDGAIFLDSMNSFSASEPVIRAMQLAYSGTIFSGFMKELRSDLLMVFINSLSFSYRSAAISFRCALEDLYRHIYYMDHPQEYNALREGRESEYSLKLSPQAFREYLKRTTYLKNFSQVNTEFNAKLELESDYFAVNEALYGALSAAVHGASEDWFAAIENASSLKLNCDKELKLADISNRFVKMSVSFLIAAHRDVFAAAGDYDKSIILDVFTPAERKSFRRFLNL
jgi:hypothetical protein